MSLIVVLIICVTNLALGLFVLLRDSKRAYARIFMTISVTICAWILASHFTEDTTISLGANDIANRISYVAGYTVVLSGLAFTYVFPVVRKVKKLEIILLLGLSAIVLFFSATRLIAGEVSAGETGRVFSIGPLIWLYIVGFVGMVYLMVRNLLKLPKNLEGIRRTQSRMLLFAFSVSALAGLIFNAVIPSISNDWHTTQFGPFATVFLSAMIVYTVARHGLFDVRLAVVRTVAYILSLLTLAGVYYVGALAISEFFLNDSSLVQPVGIALALILAFIFQPVRRFFDQLTSRLFYKDNYNADDFFARLNRELTSTTDLRALLDRAATEIQSTLKGEQVFFFVYTTGHRHMLAGTKHHTNLPGADASMFSSVYGDMPKMVVASLLATDHPVRRMMVSHKLEIAMPLIQNDVLIGYVCLGEHRTSGYTTRDMRVLETIADELGIAIQNALSILEVKKLNETLQQRVDEATKELRTSNAQLQKLDEAKDEFISMASHQLRTPLTSIKGYISMLVEGDVGKVTPDQKHLLDEAFISSERMVRLIGDFLNVSRLQTGKFVIEKQPVDLAKVVGQEIDSLLPNASARGLKFTYKAPKNVPQLSLDDSKIRQVIMNFADNAIYYSKEKSTIKVELKADPSWVEFTVKDTGIGVPESEKDHLFSKFFRATNARKQRPDGTGVGLFLAKKVIDSHDGQIIFESKEGKGSTFGFRLPIAKLRVTSNAKKLDDKPSDETDNKDSNDNGSSDPLVVEPPLSKS